MIPPEGTSFLLYSSFLGSLLSFRPHLVLGKDDHIIIIMITDIRDFKFLLETYNIWNSLVSGNKKLF